MLPAELDEETIARLKAGDAHAFADLFATHRIRLRQMLEFRMGGRVRVREDASDVLQDVYLDAHQRIHHYLKKPEMSFFVWLRQLTKQRLIDVQRKHLAVKRSVKQEVRLAVRGAATSASIARHLVSRLASPSQIMIQDEMIVQIENGLDTLDEIDREVLALRHFEELRNTEVAEILGITRAGASNRYMRALTRLREVLSDIPEFFDM